SESSIAELKKNGALILPFAQNSNFLEISFINNRNFSDKESAVLSKLTDQTLWLRLSDTQIGDKSIEEIIKLKNLTRLHLENTKITDAALSKLASLKNLEYLNLIGTQITDVGLRQLANNKNLKKIYLWQSKATQAGVDELKKSLTNATVDLGISQKEVEEFLKAKADTVSDDVYKKK
nr:leucine-rich repeat domain-containing protein [Spirosomataceae bacterium]